MYFFIISKMSLSQTNCKQIFREAYENRYTWPKDFRGYEGKCIFISEKKTYKGNFLVGKNFKPEIKNIPSEGISKLIESQLFEVVIHRIKRGFDEIHSKNNFQIELNNEKGIKMLVLGKNEGDKYRVKDNSINMVYRKMHGTIIEIFVEKFFDTGYGLLSKKYSSVQIDEQTLEPKSQKFFYEDAFIDIGNNTWALSSRTIKSLSGSKEEKIDQYIFEEMYLLE